jgi:hypothetical protein
MLHELGKKHAIFMLHTQRRKARLHGPVPRKQSPRLRTACVPPATACKRKQQRAAAQRAARLSLSLSIYSSNPRKRYRASPSGVAPRPTDGGPHGFVSNTAISPQYHRNLTAIAPQSHSNITSNRTHNRNHQITPTRDSRSYSFTTYINSHVIQQHNIIN